MGSVEGTNFPHPAIGLAEYLGKYDSHRRREGQSQAAPGRAGQRALRAGQQACGPALMEVSVSLRRQVEGYEPLPS